tara:strand:- start:434 stop:745 length:312 start_codon:yes stop_codon:yes gene_type:complete
MPIKIVPIKKNKKKKGSGGMDIGRPKKTTTTKMGGTMYKVDTKPAVKGYAGGGSLKAVPEGNKGLSKLPAPVRNKMGYMKDGGKVMKMRGGGMASRGLNFRMR